MTSCPDKFGALKFVVTEILRPNLLKCTLHPQLSSCGLDSTGSSAVAEARFDGERGTISSIHN